MNIEGLQGVAPKSVMAELPAVIDKFKINTPLRLAHFLSQCHHESAGFTAIRENLNYSAEGLLKVFPKYFNRQLANECARKPVRIANIAYANRMGNGNEASGDGFHYSGKGYIQLTGKESFRLFSDITMDNLVKNPDLVATKYPLLSAAWFFHIKEILPICDKGDRVEVITAVTKRVNGRTHGLDNRIALFKKYYKLLK